MRDGRSKCALTLLYAGGTVLCFAPCFHRVCVLVRWPQQSHQQSQQQYSFEPDNQVSMVKQALQEKEGIQVRRSAPTAVVGKRLYGVPGNVQTSCFLSTPLDAS